MSDETEEKKVITRAQAKALGLSRYFTGKPCKHGHVAERRIEGKCVECVKEDIVKNAKIYTERAAAWLKANRERARLGNIRRYYEDIEESRAKARAQYAKNPESVKRSIKKYKEKEENRIKLRVRWSNRRALKRNADGKHTKQDVDALLAQQNNCCKACDADLLISGFHVDHIFPLSRGGSNWPWNLQILCPTCNISKNAKDFEKWKASRFKCE